MSAVSANKEVETNKDCKRKLDSAAEDERASSKMRGLAASAAAEDERASKTTQKNHKPDKTEVQSTKARGAGAGREDGGQAEKNAQRSSASTGKKKDKKKDKETSSEVLSMREDSPSKRTRSACK